jgi:two-component system chemotaxis response regulator CheB
VAFELVAIGTSLGGLSALKIVLKDLPGGFAPAIAIAQHRHKESDTTLSSFLQRFTELPIHDVEDKEKILPGHVYMAPADYHLLVEPGHFSLSTDEPVSYARPSIDVLLESAADVYGNRMIAVILTGANEDGVQGLMAVKARGGFTIVQAPETAESAILPKAAIAAVKVDSILPLPSIAPYLVHLCNSAGW